MQSVNSLPVFVSQDTDLQAKESSGASADNNKETEFSSLVEQHLPEETKSNSRKETVTSEQEATATESKTVTGGGKKEVDEVDSRQESDSKESVAESKPSNETSVDEIKNKEDEVKKNASTDNGSLSESEQFIALLYNSDQTLAADGDKNKANKDTSTVNSGQKGDVDIKVDDKTTKVEKVKAEAVTVSSSKDNSASISEHKLKAFSKEELLARMQLKNSNEVTPQSSSQILKDYQLSLQSQQNVIKSESITSQQLMNAQLANGQLNNKITDVASGVSLANNSQLTEQVDSGLYQLPVEPIGKGKSLTEDISYSAKESVIKSELNQSDDKANSAVKLKDEIAAELSNKETNKEVTKESATKTAIPVIKTTNSSSEEKTVIASKGDTDKSQLTANIDKLTAERNTQATVESSPKVITSTQSQALQQVQAQQKLQSVTSEQQAVESVDEEYVDPLMLVDEKPIEQGVKTTSKGLDNITLRSISDLQNQTVQATQTKQNNDAYLDHQVSEVLNHNVVSDTAQIQKNNIQLQQETVSIFRKDFADAVKDKVMLTINQKLQQFDITLDPPEFGNMQVRVNLQGEQASVNFVVQNQQAKDALEQNMNKLRDMLSEQGVDVGDANVEQQNQQQNNDEQNLQQNNGNGTVSTNGIQKDEHNVEHVLSAKLFDSSATSVDYYA